MIINVDTREPKKYYEFIKKCFPHYTVNFIAMPEGDYSTSKVRVERKSIPDLYMSATGGNGKPGRLQAQVSRLAVHDDEIVLFLITGSVKAFAEKMSSIGIKVDRTIIYGSIASIVARERLHVIWIEDEWEAMISMIKFMEKVEAGQCMVPSRREPDNLCARLLGVSIYQWRDLKKKFNSLYKMSQASEKELMAIYGIGPAKAKKVLSILHGKE